MWPHKLSTPSRHLDQLQQGESTAVQQVWRLQEVGESNSLKPPAAQGSKPTGCMLCTFWSGGPEVGGPSGSAPALPLRILAANHTPPPFPESQKLPGDPLYDWEHGHEPAS